MFCNSSCDYEDRKKSNPARICEWKVGRDAVISVKNIEGLSCAGKMFVPVTETTTEGAIQCSDKRKGHFIANGKGDSWTGEGKLNDGSKFLILLGTKRTPLEY